MNMNKEPLSSLIEKHTLIILELQRLNALFIHYSDIGNIMKVSQVSDSIKRLELSRHSVASRIDKYVINTNTDETDEY